MAVNTAFVASSELLERVAHRYKFHWLIATNARDSLYRIHVINATFFSFIILLTRGSQAILADMYALGLLASFCINIGALLIYRYRMGTKEVIPYYTSRAGTLVMWIIMLSCFVFLAIEKPHGTILWLSVTILVIGAGSLLARTRAPEISERQQTDHIMEMILRLASSSQNQVHIYFRRPREEWLLNAQDNEVYITFYSPRHGIPPRMAPNHFRFPLDKNGLYWDIVAVLKTVEYELHDRNITVHLGWPLSSWLNRLAIGVMMFNLMKLPRIFPQFGFSINYYQQWPIKKTS
jgi:hypothetical protein